MGFIDKIVESRALKETKALVKAIDVCSEQYTELDKSIVRYEGKKAKSERDFYAAHDIGNVAAEERCLDTIETIKFAIKNLEQDRKVWGELIKVLSKIETMTDTLRRHKKFWTIVKVIPYRKLKAANFDISTIEPLTSDFKKVYEQLYEYANRIRRVDADFDKDLKQMEQTQENIRAIDEELNPVQKDAREELMRELLEKRDANKSSNIKPLERTEDDDSDNIAPA